MGHRPLVAFLSGFGPEVNLLPSGGALGPTALALALIQANLHSQVLASQNDGVYRRRPHAGCIQQVIHHAVDGLDYIFSRKIIKHCQLP
jgi:hypothetical protein